MMKRIYLLLFTILTIASARCQSVELDLFHFSGQEYYFWAFRGDGKDTIASGNLDMQGKAKLVLPESMKNFRGMTQWMLTSGGGLDIIFA